MARARARDAAAAFGRVGTVRPGGIPADSDAGDDASISASDNEGPEDSNAAIMIDSLAASNPEAGNAAGPAGQKAGAAASPRAGGKTGQKAGKKGGRARRRVGRPRGPERVALTIRILAATDARLTAAVEATGESPQYIVDAALSEHLGRLGF